MAERIDQVTIVGGGTAGWLTALILQSFLNSRRDQPPVAITLVESPNIPTIGVGEATVRGIPNLFRQLGIDERDFFRRCNATFKLAAEFKGWNLDEDGEPIYFLHPFNFPKPLDGINPAYHFLRYGSVNGKKAAEALTWNQAIITEMKGPRPLGAKDYEAVVSYAYHLDAALFGPFLRETAVDRGVTRIEDDVTGVEVDERGFVTKLNLERNEDLPVKLVIDCTGFRSVIMQGALKEEFIPYSNHLLCDRAMPFQIPVPVDRPLPAATRATALTGGWVFRVPLAERIGSGYIYSSDFKSDDEARDELIAHWRAIGDLTPEMEDPEPKIIRMKTGRTKRAWINNCIAIGLSNGFVEPLEATAIYMVESASRWLVTYFPDQGIDPVYAEAFNRRMDGLYDEVRDFLSMHFVTSNRSEPFWQAARAPGVAPDRLMEQLRLWKHTLPSDQDMFYKGLFGEWNYLYCLWEKGYFDGESYPLTPLARPESWQRFEESMQQNTAELLRRLPDHRALLSEIRGESALAPQADAPALAAAMRGVGGDGAWQAAQPVYQPAPTPQPAPSYAVQPQEPAPAYGAAAYMPATQPPPPPPQPAEATASGGIVFGAPSDMTVRPAPPPQAPGGLTYGAPASAAPATTPGAADPSAGLVFGAPSSPSPSPAPVNPAAGLVFGAPTSGGADQSSPAPASPAVPPAEPGGLVFDAPTFGTADAGASAGVTYGTVEPAGQAAGPPAAAKPEAPPPKPEPTPFERALAKRYGARPTVTTPR